MSSLEIATATRHLPKIDGRFSPFASELGCVAASTPIGPYTEQLLTRADVARLLRVCTKRGQSVGCHLNNAKRERLRTSLSSARKRQSPNATCRAPGLPLNRAVALRHSPSGYPSDIKCVRLLIA
jgi:hypothetical protein